MTATGESLGAAIDGNDPARVAELLLAADEAGRRGCDSLVRQHLRDARKEAGRLLRDHHGQLAALGLAVLGTARSPAAAAEMLNEIDVSSVRPLACDPIAAIPGLLSRGARDTHQVLTVAANVAARLGIRGHIDGLTEAADGPKASRLRTEARRLREVLTTTHM